MCRGCASSSLVMCCFLLDGVAHACGRQLYTFWFFPRIGRIGVGAWALDTDTLGLERGEVGATRQGSALRIDGSWLG